jgi:hypothetical protein
MTTRPTSDRRWTPAIEARLIALGLLDAGTGATRRARAVRCGNCRRPVILGLDADFGSCVAECDPGPLSPYGEALARLARRCTYSFRFLGGRYQLDIRDQFIIAGEGKHPRRFADVLVNHQCDSDLFFPIQPSQLPDQFGSRWGKWRDKGPDNPALDTPPF